MSHLWDIWGTSEKRGIVRAESKLWDIYETYDNLDVRRFEFLPFLSLRGAEQRSNLMAYRMAIKEKQ